MKDYYSIQEIAGFAGMSHHNQIKIVRKLKIKRYRINDVSKRETVRPGRVQLLFDREGFEKIMLGGGWHKVYEDGILKWAKFLADDI